MRISDDSSTSSNLTLLHHYISRRFLLKALGVIALGSAPFMNACGEADSGKNSEFSKRKNNTMQVSIEKPKTVSELPPIDTKLPQKTETATFALG